MLTLRLEIKGCAFLVATEIYTKRCATYKTKININKLKMETTSVYPKIENMIQQKPYTFKAVRVKNLKYPTDCIECPVEYNSTVYPDKNDPFDKGRVDWNKSKVVSEVTFFGNIKIEVLEKTQDLII